jgi:hypothetical protein
LANDAIVPLRIINRFDRMFDISTLIEESKFAGKCNFAQNIECKVVKPIAEAVGSSVFELKWARREKRTAQLQYLEMGIGLWAGVYSLNFPA